ncbi:MAG: ABC transporter ATP-binding protein [Granulosicoccus sp.]
MGIAVMDVQSKSSALPIAISNVTKRYGSVHALDDVSLAVSSGEFLTLLGPSGSGKTTLLMVLAGFTRPDCGSLKFGDTEVIRKPPHLRDVGMVFQNYALFPHMSVADNVGYPLRLRKVPKPEAEQRIENALEMVQLAGFGSRRIHQLSGGQKQRVALARSIVFEPRILLMDEPLSALDKKLRDRMQIELRRLHEQLGMTTVYVTHDQREALTMSDRIAVINHGKVMQLATPQALYETPENRFVADFIGDSTFLPVTRNGDDIFYANMPLRHSGVLPTAQKLVLMVRPERMRLMDSRQSVSTTGNVFSATVSEIVYQGDSYLMYARMTDDTEISVRGTIRGGTTDKLPVSGESISLLLDAADTILIDGTDE